MKFVINQKIYFFYLKFNYVINNYVINFFDIWNYNDENVNHDC